MPSKHKLLKIKKRKKAQRAAKKAKKQSMQRRRKEQEDYGEDVLGLSPNMAHIVDPHNA
jgi:hypothetical protein